MFKIFKYLKLLGRFRDIESTYKEETGKARPAYLSRRFVGALVIFVGAALSLYFGVEIVENILSNITESIEKVVATGIVLYGLILEIVGIVKRKKK